MGDRDQVSHTDIYRALGILEGKLDSMNQTLVQKQSDMAAAFDRIRSLESTVAKGMGVALACSIVIPILVTALAPRLHLGHVSPPPAAQVR
jgi:uncharacterized membrane protein